jgi:biotin transport system substrate-specific component
MTKNKNKIFDMVVCALFAAICCVLSPITIPIGLIPVSLGILAVMFTAQVLGSVKGLISVGVFLALGLFLPLFSGGNNGIAAYFGMTGGYIWSYLIVVVVVGLLTKIPFKNKIVEMVANVLFCLVGVAICYFCGTIQFMAITGYDINASLAACVIPFIPFDIIKCVIAGVAGPLIRTALFKAGYLKKTNTSYSA